MVSAEDGDAAILLMLEEYASLRKEEPAHPLLIYVGINKGGFSFHPSEKVKDAFLNEFAPRERDTLPVACANYYVALRDAVDEMTGQDRSPARPKKRDLWDIFPDLRE